jgi:RNA-directed DNA polymerase
LKTLELLQDGLYYAAKNKKDRKFYTLHDKICRIDILEDAWKRVSANGGSPGIDRRSIEDIETYGVSRFLGEIQHELMNMTYRVPNVKRVYIPKQDGKKGPLGIPTVKDRVVQQAVKSVIETIFEADFKDFSYAYRKGKSAKQASHEIFKYLNYGYANIVEIDIKSFFDLIDHDNMIFFVMRRMADPYVIKLIREWLRAGIVYNGERTYPTEGTPQGGVISPLLANIYLNEMDTLWSKRVDAHEAVMIRYADDIVILSKAAQRSIWIWWRRYLICLALNSTQTNQW